jgi:putative sigma-54 modulation protein
MKVKVNAIHFAADQKLEDFIQKKVDKLVAYNDSIIEGEVFLRLDKSDSDDNKVTEMKLRVPGKELFAKKQSKSFEQATDEVVEALRRQLKKYKEKNS